MTDRQKMLEYFKGLVKEYPPPDLADFATLLNTNPEFRKNKMRFFETLNGEERIDYSYPANDNVTWNFLRIQNYFPNIRKICDELNREFNVVVVCGSYYSPKSSQAFPVHFDPYEILGYQVFGSKSWKIWPQLPESIYDAELNPEQKPILNNWVPKYTPEELILKPGDCFYVAARKPHLVSTQGSDSFTHIFLCLDSNSKFIGY